MGPINWFKKYAKGVEILEDVENEYLNFMVAEIEGKKVLHFDYIFSDQAKEIIDHLLVTYYGETPEDNQTRRKVHILMYGKVGGIRPPQEINQIVIPNGIISDYDIEYKNNMFTKLANVFCTNDNDMNYILNSVSIPLQRRSILIGGQAKGCSITEMEAHYATQIINTARSQYHNLEIVQGFVGFISDTPLDGITLAENPDQRPGRKKCVEMITEYVKESK
jgi:hypothetical protein